MIVTLAGHVDHGKTSLVHALTGHNTDRLAEEQRRGLTIDLGFAYLETPQGVVGFVDVPGHHRFIHNMVAGVATGQHALLVVAADDGPMPQSREHLQILQLTGVQTGAIALTKCDMVDAARRAAAEREVRELVEGSFLADAPLFATSTTSGDGIATLLEHLTLVAARHRQEGTQQRFRLAVDRAFTIKGSGIVVTGTVHAGSTSIDQELFVLPGNHRVRVRSLHTQNQPATTAAAGDRCAVNLAGISLAQIGRGCWLSETADSGSTTLAMHLTVVDDFPRQLRHWTPVHVYHATAHSTGRVALLEDWSMPAGTGANVELALDTPLFARHGDRLVVRDQSLDITLGGGPVLVNRALPGRRRAPERRVQIAAFAQSDPGAALAQLLQLAPVHLGNFNACWNLGDAEFDALIAGTDTQIQGGHAIATAQWQEWLRAVADEIQSRHAADSTLQGLQSNELNAAVPRAFLEAVIAELVKSGSLVHKSGRYAPPRHEVELTAQERGLLDKLTPLLDQPQPPSVGDLAKQFRDSPANLRTRLRALVAKGVVVLVSDSRVYLPDQLGALLDVLEDLVRQGPFTVRQFRDAAGIGRNTAIEVLEYLDGRGYTRRNGDTRQLVGDRSRVLPG